MKKRFLALVMSTYLLAGMFPLWTLAAGTFSDVAETAYYAPSVEWAVEREITRGTTQTTFSPNNTCTIAQITTFLWRACGSPEPDLTENPFTDIKEGDYFYKAALWASENGITVPDVDSNFPPNQFHGEIFCPRSLVVYYLWKLQGYPDSPAHEFQDVDASNSLAQAVSWAVEHNITKGTTDTTFSPDNTCTRAQIVTFLYRAEQAGQLRGKPYQVTMDSNGGVFRMGEGTNRVKINVTRGDTYKVGEILFYLEREGYEFAGWYTEREGGSLVVSSTPVTQSGPHTLYAHWTPADTRTVIDGVDVNDARKIQDNLYYYCPAGDYSLYEKYRFADTVKALYQEFSALFGTDPLRDGVPLLIKLEKDSPNPNTNFMGSGYRIRLRDYRDAYDEDYETADGYEVLHGMFGPIHVYELGHELAHFFIASQQNCTDLASWVSFQLKFEPWNEELMAEAMSLLMLHRLNDSQVRHPTNGYTLSRYLKLCLDGRYAKDEEKVARITDAWWGLEAFKEIAAQTADHNCVLEHPVARYLYETLSEYPDSDIRHIIELYDYYNADGYIDYDRWEADYGASPNFITALRRIQPEIRS